MSTSDRTETGAGLDSRDRASIVALIGLIVLSIWWPAPVLWLNELTLQSPVAIDDEAFLGREALQWDVVFWWIAGLVALAIAGLGVPADGEGAREVGKTVAELPWRFRIAAESLDTRRVMIWTVGSLGLLASMVLIVDPLVIGWLTGLDQSRVLGVTSLLNRFGGGIAPTITVLFIGVVGISRGRDLWVRLFLAISSAAGATGVVLQVVKLLASRSRPEVGYGALAFWTGGASMPSGHTLAVFIVAGAVALSSRSAAVRLTMISLAVAVAIARVLTFRHWPSDVTFSALLGLGAIWFFHRVWLEVLIERGGN